MVSLIDHVSARLHVFLHEEENSGGQRIYQRDHCFYTACALVVIFSWYPYRSSVRYRKYMYATSAYAGLACDPYWTCEDQCNCYFSFH
ncbi:hypothetical protein G5714_024616 [Onychostoma macrolepis]|uniref:Uncharacterized protein n=1 Tax=Onychostoma macrolepis TaxID=369639 RepID=A0A7J6BHC0_9TELE|nr:hypothetical protein G5714_024616 [Onychostoma macrolepis]